MIDLTLKFGEDLSGNTFTCSNVPDCESNRVDLLVIKKLAEEVENAKIMKRIVFSKKDCELKKLYFDAFDKLPKKGVNNFCMGGIEIVEDDLPSNVMVWEYNKPEHKEMFYYANGKLLKIPKYLYPNSQFAL